MKASQKESQLVWAVVLVERGIPSEVSVYADPASVLKRVAALRKQMNENDDALGIFEGTIGHKSFVEIGIPEMDD